jgi:hypothetical protein
MNLNLDPMKFRKKFGVIKLWPDIQVAEDENIQRIKRTAQHLGLECVELNWKGFTLQEPVKKMTADDLDFVIHLHFETPKVYDIFSFHTLWNPPTFFHNWGYQKYSSNLITHDDYLSCGGVKSDHMIVRKMADEPMFNADFLTMYLSLSEPILEPTTGNLKLFYIGINWERVNNTKGRFHELLKVLDEKSLIRIYGPKKLQGVRVWEGFENYVSDLPFDGVSCIHAIHEAGICLVLSSDAHRDAQMASNRIYEGTAAGTIVIADENAFIREHFGDSILYIDSTRTPPEIVDQIEKHITWIQHYPEEALKKIRAAQAIFQKKFRLDYSISAIYESLHLRKGYKLASGYDISSLHENVRIYFLLPNDNDKDLEEICRTIKHQNYSNISAVVLTDFSTTHPNKINSVAQGFGVNVKIQHAECYLDQKRTTRQNRGAIITKALAEDKELEENQLICFIEPHEKIFSDHILQLFTKMGPRDSSAACPVIFFDSESDNTDTHGVLWPNTTTTLEKFPIGTSSLLFRWTGLSSKFSSYIPYLDKLTLLGLCDLTPPSRNTKPTVLMDTSHPWCLTPSKTQFSHEVCYMQDVNPWNAALDDHALTQAKMLIASELSANTLRFDRLILDQFSIKQKRRIFFNLFRYSIIPHWIHRIANALFRKN